MNTRGTEGNCVQDEGVQVNGTENELNKIENCEIRSHLVAKSGRGIHVIGIEQYYGVEAIFARTKHTLQRLGAQSTDVGLNEIVK